MEVVASDTNPKTDSVNSTSPIVTGDRETRRFARARAFFFFVFMPGLAGAFLPPAGLLRFAVAMPSHSLLPCQALRAPESRMVQYTTDGAKTHPGAQGGRMRLGDRGFYFMSH
ncbi:hypothetical protein FACS1894196_2830 [Clostridia bacterium]|nr:hypothetical protein FACS1894196_2830 [Clostridia bacterium]